MNPAWLGFRRGSPTGPSSWRRSSEPPVRPARAGSWTNLLFLRAGTREPFSSSSRATGPKELARYEELYRRRAYLGAAEAKPLRAEVSALAKRYGVRDRRAVRLAPPTAAQPKQLALAVWTADFARTIGPL